MKPSSEVINPRNILLNLADKIKESHKLESSGQRRLVNLVIRWITLYDFYLTKLPTLYKVSERVMRCNFMDGWDCSVPLERG